MGLAARSDRRPRPTHRPFRDAVLLALLLISSAQAVFASQRQPYTFVDPMIGARADREGATIVGPTLPNGSIHPSPETLPATTAGYRADAPISGFAQLHAQGSGGAATYGTFLLSPQSGKPEFDEPLHLSAKANEHAGADAYSVTLARYGVNVEVTPAHYAALYRFTYPAAGERSLVLDLTRKVGGAVATAGAEVTIFPEQGKVVGRVRTKGFWSPAQVDIWFCARIDVPPQGWGVFKGTNKSAGATVGRAGQDQRLGVWLTLPNDTSRPVLVKIAVSFTSAARAEALLDKEMPDWDYESVRDRARAAWNAELKRVQLSGVNDRERTRFYTALYHTAIQPRDRSLDQADADLGTPNWDDYYTLWDSYRTLFPLWSVLRPKEYADNIASMIAHFDRWGAVDTAFIGGRNYHVGQGGDEADNVLGEGLLRGVPNVDWKRAAEIALFNAHERRRPRYLLQGFFAVGDRSPEPDHPRAESGSSTLAFALNDFYAARLAAAAGRTREADELLKRSANWRNVWNPDVRSDGFSGFAMPRTADGRFVALDPKAGWDGKAYRNDGFYEGTAWIYSYAMLQDVPGMVQAMGGRDRFVERLDHALRAGLIDLTNEPSFSTPWLFAEVGRPDLASYWADRVFARFGPNAYPGDEDNGAMSSHYVLNRLGLFPKLGSDLFYLHAPHQPGSAIELENGRVFRIIARNHAPGNVYIVAARLNGQRLDRPYIAQGDIMRGGALELVVGPKPGRWATSAGDREGKYLVGARLPPERDLTERFGVGRPTVREAMIGKGASAR